MQQPCSRCGYISDRPARFCRQCGSALFNETESSSAATRNYSPQQAQPQYSNQPGTYAPYAPLPLDDQTPDTSPFYRPPIVPQYQVPQQPSSNWGKWILISLAVFLMLATVTIGGAIYVLKPSLQDEARSSGEVASGIPAIPPVPDIPPIPGMPPPPPAPGSLDSYKYPEATVTESHRDGASEVIKMTTDDDLETVKEFYDEKFKNASIQIKNEDGQKFIFTTLGPPILTIIVQPDEERDGKTEINLIRANIPIPKIAIPRIEIP